MFILELLILLVIVGEVLLPYFVRQREQKKRGEIFKRIIDGQTLLDTAPFGRGSLANAAKQDDLAIAVDWATKVDSWIEETKRYLQDQCSPEAAAVFKMNDGMPTGFFAALPVEAQRQYRQLLVRLRNLRAIVERPEIYYS